MTLPPMLLDFEDVPGITPTVEAPRLLPAPRERAKLEIGVVYRKGARYYLAVSERTLITFRGDQVHEVRPHTSYDPVRSLSVDELCRSWGIDTRRLDEVVGGYVAPASVRTRPRGERRERGAAELVWLLLRRRRIAVAG
jgi:hypothetical protein